MNAHSQVMIDLSGSSLTADEKALLSNYSVGGICLFRRNVRDRFQLADFTAELKELCSDQLLIGIDQEGGTVLRITDVPTTLGHMALGSANDVSLTGQLATMTARGLKSVGVNVNFAPVADINNNPLNPVIADRSFGANANLVSKHVVAYVQGMQAEGVAATLKHFPGHGNTDIDSHHDLPRLEANLAELHNLELIPFKSGIAAGAACMMSYHGIITALDKNEAGTLSKAVMTQFLRDTLGFDGVSFSDALEMQAIANKYAPEEAVVRALAAGVDMPLYDVHESGVLKHESIFKAVDAAAKEGRLEQDQLSKSQERLKRLALRYPSETNETEIWLESDHALLEKAALKSVCTLGNLPVVSKERTITLISSDKKVGGSASDLTDSPAFALKDLLESSGYKVTPIFYSEDQLDEESILMSLEGLSLFVSASRQLLSNAEVELANRVASKAESFIHVGLWNPYSSEAISKPCILSFGFQAASLKQVVRVLEGESAQGNLPF